MTKFYTHKTILLQILFQGFTGLILVPANVYITALRLLNNDQSVFKMCIGEYGMFCQIGTIFMDMDPVHT